MKKDQHTRPHFTFFLSFREQIDLCDEGDQLLLYRAITDFALFGKDTEFKKPLLKIAWLGIRPNLQKGWKNYMNGCNGGAPIGNENAKKQAKNKPKTTEKQTIGEERRGKDRNGKGNNLKNIEKENADNRPNNEAAKPANLDEIIKQSRRS